MPRPKENTDAPRLPAQKAEPGTVGDHCRGIGATGGGGVCLLMMAGKFNGHFGSRIGATHKRSRALLRVC
jgi:hypothetical protein